MARQEDVILEINKFGSMNSFNEPDSIDDTQMELIVNFCHVGNKLVSRPPHKRVMNNNTAGIWFPVGGGQFQDATTTTFIFGTENGRLWKHTVDGNAPTEITLSGGNALTAGNSIDVVQYFGDCYVTDQVQQLKLNLSTNVATDISSKLPADITKPFRQAFWQNRYWVSDTDGRIASSQQEANIQTDVTPYDTTGSAFATPVTDNDGQLITGIAVGNRIFNINKQLARDRTGSSYTITGVSEADFRLDQISPTLTFLGDSAVAIGGDIFGLTVSGFRFLSAVQQLGDSPSDVTAKAGANFETRKVPDWVLDLVRGINYDHADKITGIYNEAEHAYYCAIPHGDSITKNSMVIRVDFTDGQIRYSIFTNTFAQVFFKRGGFVYFIDDVCRIWKLLDPDQTTYEEQEYHKLLVTKAYKFGAIATTHYVNSFGVETKVKKDDKTFNLFYNAEVIGTNDKNLVFETNKKGNITTAGQKKVEEKLSSFDSKYNFTIMNRDQTTAQRSRKAYKEQKIGESVQSVQGILSDQVSDTTGTETIELTAIKFKGKPIREAP